MLAKGDKETFLSDLRVIGYTDNGYAEWEWKFPSAPRKTTGCWDEIPRHEDAWHVTSE